MGGKGVQRWRSAAVAIAALGLTFLAGTASGQSGMIVDDFETYENTDALRSIWDFVGDPSGTLDLECASATCWEESWCSVHDSEGPANEGCKYMRINYLSDALAARVVVNPAQDWRGFERVNFYFRGRWDFVNGEASIQVVLTGNGGSDVFYGPVVPAASQCDYFTYPSGCPWIKYEADASGWPGLASVELFDIVVTPAGTGGGRIYVDAVDAFTTGPLPVEQTTWGMIKALYR